MRNIGVQITYLPGFFFDSFVQVNCFKNSSSLEQNFEKRSSEKKYDNDWTIERCGGHPIKNLNIGWYHHWMINELFFKKNPLHCFCAVLFGFFRSQLISFFIYQMNQQLLTLQLFSSTNLIQALFRISELFSMSTNDENTIKSHQMK